MAWLPYLLLVAFVLAWGEPSIKTAIDTWTQQSAAVVLPMNAAVLNGLNVPGLHNLITRVPPVDRRSQRRTRRSSPSTG